MEKLSEAARLELRRRCLSSLHAFCIAVMGYMDLTDDIHVEVCHMLEDPCTRKQITLPRGFLKTCISSIAYPIWISLPRKERLEFPNDECMNSRLYQLGPNIRVLIASNVVTNAQKILNNIKKIYERGKALQVLFPEVIPVNFDRVKWSDASACIERDMDFTESTFEAAGVGGSAVSRHYDIIIEDDLIYAKKDDLSGKELMPDQDDIDKAIGWHKLALSLFVPGPHTTLINVGTRWAKHDLVDYIRANEPEYKILDVKAEVQNEEGERVPRWPEMYPLKQLDRIKCAQGPYMYATQYLNLPMSPEDMLFKPEWLQYYDKRSEVPEESRIFTTVDLAGWGTSKRAHLSRAVVLTCAWCPSNHMWVLHYDVGRFNPTEVIEIMAKHWRLFAPEYIGVEEIYFQKALRHFAQQAMDKGEIPRMSIRGIKPEGHESKEIRIRGLEPLASNLAIHVKREHKDFIEEFLEYAPNNNSITKDILDAASYQVQIARPGIAKPVGGKGDRNDFISVGTIDEFLESIWNKNKNVDLFNNPLPPKHIYEDSEHTYPEENVVPFEDWA